MFISFYYYFGVIASWLLVVTHNLFIVIVPLITSSKNYKNKVLIGSCFLPPVLMTYENDQFI